MTVVILAQPDQSAAWSVLPGTYDTFQAARDMVQFLRPTFSAEASFGIESVEDVERKGWLAA
jgi:hypothetical protein